MLPRDAVPPVVRRLAYRPPSHLVDDIELRFELDPAATRVAARFAYRRNPAADPGAEYVRVILPDKIRLAREYVRRSSVLFDLSLILRTLGAVVGGRPQ